MLTAERRSVGLDTKRVYAINGVVGDFTGVEVVTVAVGTVYLVPVTLPSPRLIGAKGYAGGLAHDAAATQQHDTAIVRAGQCFAVHGGGCFIFHRRF